MKLIVLLSLFAVCSLSAPSYLNAFMTPQDAQTQDLVQLVPKMEPTSRDQEKIAGQVSGNSTSPLEDNEGSGETSSEEKVEEKDEENNVEKEEDKEEDRRSSSSSESVEKRSDKSQEKKGPPSGGSEEKTGSKESTTMSADETTQEDAYLVIYDTDQLPPRS